MYFIWISGCVMRLFQSITRFSNVKLYIVVFRVVSVQKPGVLFQLSLDIFETLN